MKILEYFGDDSSEEMQKYKILGEVKFPMGVRYVWQIARWFQRQSFDTKLLLKFETERGFLEQSLIIM